MATFEFVSWLVKWIFAQENFEFEWDDGNIQKNKSKHDVTNDEAEELFVNSEFLVPLGIQVPPSVSEPRFGALGVTSSGRLLSVCFAIRDGRIRVISIRPMSKKERKHYEQICQK